MHHVDRYGIGKVVDMALDHVGRDRPIHLSFDVGESGSALLLASSACVCDARLMEDIEHTLTRSATQTPSTPLSLPRPVPPSVVVSSGARVSAPSRVSRRTCRGSALPKLYRRKLIL